MLVPVVNAEVKLRFGINSATTYTDSTGYFKYESEQGTEPGHYIINITATSEEGKIGLKSLTYQVKGIVEPTAENLFGVYTVAPPFSISLSVEDMKNVIVKPEHVAAIYYYLKWVYSKESCGYDRYSATMRRDDLNYTKVKEKFKKYDRQSIELLLNTRAVTQRICHIITGNKDVGEALQRWLFLNRCVYLDGSAPLKDKKFSDLLRRLIADPDIKETADEELPAPGGGVDLDGEAQGWQAEIEFE